MKSGLSTRGEMGILYLDGLRVRSVLPGIKGFTLSLINYNRKRVGLCH